MGERGHQAPAMKLLIFSPLTPGTEVGDVQAGHIAGQLDDVGGARLLDVLGRQRRDRERHVLQVGGALLRGDDDFFGDFVLGRLRLLRDG
jgi:hypothetical protein